MIFGRPVREPFKYEKFNRVFFGSSDSPDMPPLSNQAETRPAEMSDIQIVELPVSFGETYGPFLEKCQRHASLDDFNDGRQLDTLESMDHGWPLLKELFRHNPALLKSVIKIAKSSRTKDMWSTAMKNYLDYERLADGSEILLNPSERVGPTEPTDPTDPTEPTEPMHVDDQLYGDQINRSHSGSVLRRYEIDGSNYAPSAGVRVLIHHLITAKNRGNMTWHFDDQSLCFSNGEYGLGTLLIPATENIQDAVCTEISGYDIHIPKGKALWLPCNVLHRGITTQDLPRKVYAIEFLAFGRGHKNSDTHNVDGVKDYLALSLSALLEEEVKDPMTSAAHGSMSYLRTPFVSNPYVV